MKIIIPTSVDVKTLVSGLNLSDTKSKNLKYRIYYILSRIVVYNENMEFYEDNNYYRTICSENMKDILGGKSYRQVMNLLTCSDDPIIESDNSYQTGKFCKSYRLTDKYNTGEVEYRSLPDSLNLVKRIKKHKPSYMEGLKMMEKYDFLIKQFDGFQLSMDPSVCDYIRNTYQLLINRVDRNNTYQTLMVHNLIGRWLNIIDRLNTGDFNPMVSGKNHRLNSIFTQIPKNLRPWILCNGKPLWGVDVKSCQPYLLASVMKDEFFNSEDEGYNLKTIYPSLFYNLYNRNLVRSIWDKEQNWVVSDTGYSTSYNINSTGFTNNNLIYSSSTNKYSPFMWGKKFTLTEVKNIQEYQNIPFEDDYYSFVIKTNSEPEIPEDELERERNSLKKSTMYILFDGDLKRRNNNPKVKYMNKSFPGVNLWLESALEHIGGKELSYLLQRAESYFLLNNVSRRFNELNPYAPIFTIHDGLYTFEEHIETLKNLITDTGLELTGVLTGVKFERLKIEINPSENGIDTIWKKFKWIKSKKQFEKKRRVFKSNIERALKFINIIN